MLYKTIIVFSVWSCQIYFDRSWQISKGTIVVRQNALCCVCCCRGYPEGDVGRCKSSWPVENIENVLIGGEYVYYIQRDMDTILLKNTLVNDMKVSDTCKHQHFFHYLNKASFLFTCYINHYVKVDSFSENKPVYIESIYFLYCTYTLIWYINVNELSISHDFLNSLHSCYNRFI